MSQKQTDWKPSTIALMEAYGDNPKDLPYEPLKASKMNVEENTFSLKIQVKDPKENAPEYRITTIQELFSILTEENLDRFLKDFETGMRSSIAMREMIYSIAKAQGTEPDESLLQMPEFTWIDDRKE